VPTRSVGTRTRATVLAIAIVSLGAVAALGGGFWLARRRRRPEEPLSRFHCSRCGQRFRYRTPQTRGRPMCPRCLVYLRLPAVTQAG
jgi:hypothetical protein